MNYADRAVGRFVVDLERRGLLDSTIVAVYGDHQAFLGERELGRLDSSGAASPVVRFVRAKRVPLMIRLPFGKGASNWPTVGGHIDVSPTLLSLLGIEDAANIMLGRDLTAPGPAQHIFETVVSSRMKAS